MNFEIKNNFIDTAKIIKSPNHSERSCAIDLIVIHCISLPEGDFLNSNVFNKKNLFSEKSNMDKSSFEYSDFDELISDKGVIYKNHSEDNLFEPKGKYNEELFEQFKQFIMFQKMIQNKH